MQKTSQLSSMIKEMIFSGAFLSGEKLPPERKLAKSFGASRPAIHEALLQLQADGIVTIRPRHGCVVKDFSSSQSISLLNELYLNNRLEDSSKIEQGLVEFREMILERIIQKLLAKTKAFSELETNAFYSSVENLIDFSTDDDFEKIALEDFDFYCNLVALSDEAVFLLFFKMAKTIYIHQFTQFLTENQSSIKKISTYKKEFLETLKKGRQKKAIEMMKLLTQPATYREVKTLDSNIE